MKPAPIGTRIRVISKKESHDYRIGGIYRVHEIDDDGTFKAADEHGIRGNFIRWTDCEPAAIGWDWLRGQLDARSLELLSAFDGVEHLTLRPEVETMLLEAIPRLEDAILDTLPAIEALAECAAVEERDEDADALLFADD